MQISRIIAIASILGLLTSLQTACGGDGNTTPEDQTNDDDDDDSETSESGNSTSDDDDDDDDDDDGDDDDDDGDDDDDDNDDDDDDNDDDDDDDGGGVCKSNSEDAEAKTLEFVDNHIASPSPPGNLAPKDTPQIVVFGWDDVENVAGMTFVNDLLGGITNPDGSKGGTNLNPNACYATGWGQMEDYACGPGDLANQRELVTMHGFDIANHTIDHLESVSTWSGIPADWKDPELGGWKYDDNGFGPGVSMPESLWKTVLEANATVLHKVYSGIEITGFRAPRLEVNDHGLHAVKAMGYYYDQDLEEILPLTHVDAAVSLDVDKEEGFNWVNWPYTLDNGSPGIWTQQQGGTKDWVVNYPKGLWEIPVYMLYLSEKSGLGKTIADRMLAADKACTFPDDWPADQRDHCFLGEGELNPGDVIKQVTSFDFNTFIRARFTKDDWVAAMKNTFLLRYHGNRAPLTFGTHPVQYSSPYDEHTLGMQANNFGFRDVLDWNRYTDRQAALREFIDWAKSNYGDEVYFMSARQLADYMREPFDLKGNKVEMDKVAEPASNGLFNRLGWSLDDATIDISDGNTAEITFDASNPQKSVTAEGVVKKGALKGVSHFDIEYETEIPFRIRLLAEGKPSVTVLLAGVGGTRTARIRAKDFSVGPYVDAKEVAKMDLVDDSYMEAVTSIVFESAANEALGFKTYKTTIKQITLHGVATEDLCDP